MTLDRTVGARKAPSQACSTHPMCQPFREISPPATVVRRPSNSPVGAGYMLEALAWAGPYHKPPFAAVQAARIVATDWRPASERCTVAPSLEPAGATVGPRLLQMPTPVPCTAGQSPRGPGPARVASVPPGSALPLRVAPILPPCDPRSASLSGRDACCLRRRWCGQVLGRPRISQSSSTGVTPGGLCSRGTELWVRHAPPTPGSHVVLGLLCWRQAPPTSPPKCEASLVCSRADASRPRVHPRHVATRAFQPPRVHLTVGFDGHPRSAPAA